MSRFSNLTDDEREQLHKLLDDRYLLIKKNKWYHFLGGATAFLVAVFAVSWAGTRAGLFANRAEAAANRIDRLKTEAEVASEDIQHILTSITSTNVVLRQLQTVHTDNDGMVRIRYGTPMKVREYTSEWELDLKTDGSWFLMHQNAKGKTESTPISHPKPE